MRLPLAPLALGAFKPMLFCLTLMGFCSPASRGADVSFYAVQKDEKYIQGSAGTPTPGGGNPYRFGGIVAPSVSGSVQSATVTAPGGTGQALAFDMFFEWFDSNAKYPTQAALDAAFPTGNYTVVINTLNEGQKTLTLNLPAGTFPSAPHISNWTAAQAIDPTADFTLSWDPFVGGTTNDFIVVVMVNATNGFINFRSPEPFQPGVLDGTATSVVIPVANLQPSTPYQVEIVFFKVESVDKTSYPGAAGIVGFDSFTDATLMTTSSTVPFAPTNWPATVSPAATVNYGIFDPNAAFATPAGWNASVSLAGGGDQTFQSITLSGLTGDQSTSTYVNIADTAFTAWANTPVLDILLQVYGNGNLYHLDGSGINISILTGTLLSGTQNNLHAVSAGLTPPGADNSQWNWMLLSITNAISPITGNRYVGFVPANAAGGFQNGGVNSGTLRIQNLPGIIVRAVAIGAQGAFGTSNQVNVFAPPPSCPEEPAVNLALVDINARLTNHLVILNNSDQTVSYQSNVGPSNDRRAAVRATATYMNFGILSNYLGAPCNFPRPMKVCVEVYDDPALTGASFGPEAYATDSSGDTATYQGPLYTLQGSDQWLRVAFVVPNVDLAGTNTAPLTGGPRLVFNGGFPFFDRVELGVYRTGTNALAGLDPDATFYLDPNICTTNYGNYAELDLQNAVNNNLAAGNSGGDQLMVQELAGPANDQRLSIRPDGGDNNLQFAIQNLVFGPTYQDNARVAQVLTYYDDPAIAGAAFYPQVYQSWVGGVSSLKFSNPNTVAVTLRGTDKWLDAYFELPDANFAGVNQGPQSLVRYQTTPAKAGDPASGYVHVTRVRYAVIRPCGPYAGLNLLQTNKPLADLGDTVSGFQDDFSGATRNTNWVALGAGGDNYLQQGGLLKVFATHGDPNHLVYQAPGYSNDVQEVLARIRVVAFQSGDPSRAGIGVGVGTNSQGMNFLFRDNTNEAPVRHFQFRDDGRAWSPASLTSAWTNNSWYWLRLRQDPKMDGSNTVFGKVWPADWVTPEPAAWQLTWADSALPMPHRTGYAGLTASSDDGLAQYEVSYFLLKAAGLPSIQVSAAASPPAVQPPFFIGSGVTTSPTNVAVNWFGSGALVASEMVTGPWTNVVSTTNSYTTPISKLKAAEFYRLQYAQ